MSTTITEEAPREGTEAGAEETPELVNEPAALEPVVIASPPGSFWPLLVALALPVLFFFVLPPLTRSGLWDPYELNVADLSRRIALNLHGAAGLALEGADNSLPHLNDLGKPQLPFTSIALGFRYFGLHEWAGRAPLAVWGVLGVLATYGFVARLFDRRAGAFAALVLTTMPLYFVQARTMLGDIVTMSAFAMAFGGLSVVVFDRRDDGTASGRARVLWTLVAATGLVSGWFSRGGLLGVAVPLLSVGIAWAVTRLGGRRVVSPAGSAAGAASLAAGAMVLFFALRALAGDKRADLDPWVGAMLRPPQKYPTFDFMIGHLVAALAPWSGLAPFAFGRLASRPPVASRGASDRESEARLALLVAAGVAFVAHGWMAARTDLVAFVAPAVIAAGIAVALRDFERGAHPSVAVGVGTAVILGLTHHELKTFPEKTFHAFAVTMSTFPDAFKKTAASTWTLALVGFAGLAFLTFVERDEKRTPFDPKGYLRVLIALRDAWDGLLALAYFAMVAGASLAGLAVWVGARTHARWLPTLSGQMKDVVLNAWWATAFGPLVIVFGAFFWCDVWLWTFGRARPLGRGSFVRGFEPFEDLAARIKEVDAGSITRLVLGKLEVTKDALDGGVALMALFVVAPLLYLQIPGVVFLALHLAGVRTVVAAASAIPSGILLFLVLGLVGDLFRGSRAAFFAASAVALSAVLSVSFYPGLANQLSPKEVFESFRKVQKNGEQLALFGVGGRTAAYYAGGQPAIFRDTESAFSWLYQARDGGPRRFLAARTEELARLNRLWRERSGSGTNLPVLDGRSSQIILVGSSLLPTEKSENTLDRIVLSEPPKPQRKLEANLEEKLLVLGYDVTDANGRLVDAVTPGKKYHLKSYFKVLAPLGSDWEMFVHIDGFHKRHNGDHKPAEGKYPTSLWTTGDIVMDDYEFSLEPNFSPGGYTVYFGLFLGDTRLKVVSGPSDNDNRVNGGTLRVQ